MAIKAILFDLDGTLADTVPVCIGAFQATVEHFSGYRMSEAEVVDLFGVTEMGMLAKALPGRLQEVRPFYLNEYERLHAACSRPFPGLEQIAEALRSKGILKAIVTGKGQDTADISLRILGLDGWAEFVEVGFPDRADKPASMRKAMGRWGLQPQEVAYVGDMLSDMQAAVSAGVMPLGAAWAESSTLRLDAGPAQQVFASMAEFIRWVERI